MKTSGIIAMLALLAAMPASQACAKSPEHGKKSIQMLNDSAVALSGIDADLAARLKQYAVKEEGEMAGAENEATRKEDIQLLKDSAAALKKSRPDLNKALKRYANRESREMTGR